MREKNFLHPEKKFVIKIYELSTFHSNPFYRCTSGWIDQPIAKANAKKDLRLLPSIEKPKYPLMYCDRDEKQFLFLYEHPGIDLKTYLLLASSILTIN